MYYMNDNGWVTYGILLSSKQNQHVTCKADYCISISESTYATLPRTTRGASIVLGGDPKGKNFLYTNGNSVIIRDIAVSVLYINCS